MNPFTYYHGITFPDSLAKKIEKLTTDGYLTFASRTMNHNGYHADRFHADGTPAVFDPNSIFPCYTAHYLGVPIPESLLSVPEGYCTHASVAAYKWLQKITMSGKANLSHFDGESFNAQVNGMDAHFTFPTTVLRCLQANPTATGTTPTYREKQYAVIPFPDVSDNNEDWHNGSIPYYAEVQAHLLLWCWWYSTDVLKRHTECPVDCYIVRITGNTPDDITVRVVHSDPPKQEALVSRIVKRIKDKTNPAEDNMRIRKQGTWLERKQTEEANAYHVDDPNTYKLVRDYMAAKTTRMTLKAQSDALKEQMDALAVKLACLTAADSRAGTVVDVTPTGMGKVMYKVTHTPKMFRPSHTVPADLVQQFFPEYSDCITVIEKPRGSVTIEAM